MAERRQPGSGPRHDDAPALAVPTGTRAPAPKPADEERSLAGLTLEELSDELGTRRGPDKGAEKGTEEDGEGQPAPNSFTARLNATRDRATAALDSARGRSRIVDAASTILLRPRLVADTVLAGYLAMRLFILFFPLAYVAVAGLGLYAQSSDSAEHVASDAGLAPAVTQSIADAANSSSRNHWIALIIGLGATVWAARGVLRALRAMHALAWGVLPPKSGLKPHGPLLTAGMVVTLTIGYSMSDRLRDRGVSWVAAHLVAVVVVSGVWLLASLLLPRRPTPWYALVPGALLFGLGIEGLSLATTLYFAPKASTASAAYGALGIGLVLLSWLAAVGWIVILAVEMNAGLWEWWRRQRPGPMVPDGPAEDSSAPDGPALTAGPDGRPTP